MTAQNKATVSKILALQLLIVIGVSACFFVIKGLEGMVSPVAGGLAAFIPNLYFAFRIHRSSGKGARKILNSFYIGESGKLILTALLFYMIFQIPNIEIVPLLIGYITALSVFWFALILR